MKDIDMGYDQVPCIDEADLREPMLTAADCARSWFAATCHADQMAAMDARLRAERAAMRHLYLRLQALDEADHGSDVRHIYILCWCDKFGKEASHERDAA